MGKARYYTHGFIPVTDPPPRISLPVAASINIVKGDAVFDNGSGYVTNAITAFAATFLGIAAADADNSSGSTGAIDCEIFPLDMKTRYIVPVAANAVITQTIVGTYCNLSNNDDIAINTNVSEGIGFFVEEIDASTNAVAANTYGYAIGRFRIVGTQA